MPIFDQGYQHWSGELGGRLRRWWAITTYGVRAGRKQWVLRIVLLASWAPAIALAGFLCLWSLIERKSSAIQGLMPMLSFINPRIIADPVHYRLDVWTLAYHYFLQAELRFSMILILLAGPGLISLDLRFNALPLYFSRPLRRFDYFVGKLGVIFWFLAAVVILPSLIAYALGMACSLDISILRDTFMILVNSIFFGLVVTVSAGLFILALSSLTRNSRYVALLWVGIWIISSVTSGILDSAQEQQKGYARRREFRMEIERRRASRGMAPAPVYAIPDDAGQSPATTALEDAKTDWRPLVSYFANLSRVENHLLGVNETWERIAQLVPDEQRDYFLILQEGDRYPVSWSAGVIVGLCGLSILILNFRVKSLDRLK